MGMGCNYGDDVDSEKLRPRDLTIDPADRVLEDRVGLLVFELQPLPSFEWSLAHAPDVSGSGPRHDLMSTAQGRYNGDWQDELRLAYQLVHSSLSDTNPETRFILLVTAIEALIPHREEDAELSCLLDALKPLVDGISGFDENTRNTVKKLIEGAKFESTRQFALKLIERLSGEYGGKTPRRYFDDVYGTRSALAHGNLRNMPALSEDALNQQYLELLRFVLDILEAWTSDRNSGAETGEGQADGNGEDGPSSTHDGTAE